MALCGWDAGSVLIREVSLIQGVLYREVPLYMLKCAFRSIFLPQIRGLPIDKALIQTELSPKKAARIIREVLRDTQLRAERTFNLDPHKLYIGAYNKYMYYVYVYAVRS